MSRLVPERYLLYAEDDPDDREFLADVVARVDPKIEVITCKQGLECYQFLHQLHPGDPFPCCVILDMNMPMWDGIRTLEEIKRDTDLQHLPVILFTTSAADRDAKRALQLGAEAFITKPVQQGELTAIAKRFSLFCQYTSTRKPVIADA